MLTCPAEIHRLRHNHNWIPLCHILLTQACFVNSNHAITKHNNRSAAGRPNRNTSAGAQTSRHQGCSDWITLVNDDGDDFTAADDGALRQVRIILADCFSKVNQAFCGCTWSRDGELLIEFWHTDEFSGRSCLASGAGWVSVVTIPHCAHVHSDTCIRLYQASIRILSVDAAQMWIWSWPCLNRHTTLMSPF